MTYAYSVGWIEGEGSDVFAWHVADWHEGAVCGAVVTEFCTVGDLRSVPTAEVDSSDAEVVWVAYVEWEWE